MDSLINIREFLKKYQNKKFKIRIKKISKNSLELIQQDINYKETMQFLDEKYNDGGYGFKSLIKEYNLPVTYTKLKFLFDLVGIKRRHGYNVVTDKLRHFRSIKAKNELSERRGFFAIDVQEKLKIKNSTARGIQGYYYNKSKRNYVWLRSSWEFIYAKWLDSKKIDWDVEVQTYVLNSNKRYRPDFFIYENKKLVKIVEVKGYWKDKVWKYTELNETLSDIDLILITDIKPYIIEHNTLSKAVEYWKNNRKLSL